MWRKGAALAKCPLIPMASPPFGSSYGIWVHCSSWRSSHIPCIDRVSLLYGYFYGKGDSCLDGSFFHLNGFSPVWPMAGKLAVPSEALSSFHIYMVSRLSGLFYGKFTIFPETFPTLFPHLYGFSLEWILLWEVSWELQEKLFPHSIHIYGLSLGWIFLWEVSSSAAPEGFSTSQTFV